MSFLRQLFGRAPATPGGAIEAAKQDDAAQRKDTKMQVRNTATGQILHVERSREVDLLIAAGIYQPVAPRAAYVPPKTVAKFSIQAEINTGNFVIVADCSHCRQQNRWPGVYPDKVHTIRFWHCGYGQTVPAAIAEKYAALPEYKVAAAMTAAAPIDGEPSNTKLADELAARKEKAESGTL